MEELKEALLRVGSWLVALALGGIGLLLVLRTILPALANTATAFIGTPGGILLVVGAWWWLRRRRGNH